MHKNASTEFCPFEIIAHIPFCPFEIVYGFIPDTIGSLAASTQPGAPEVWVQRRADIHKQVVVNVVEAKLF